MIRIQKSPIFDTRFVPHRHIWLKDDNDVCYECIDRTNYSSVVVRLQRFSTTDMERRKKGIQKAVEMAIKHPSLCDLKEVLIDEENCITVSISENARGISFLRFVELCSNKAGYDAALKTILQALLKLYEDLHTNDLDLSSLSLAHVVISLKNNSVHDVESVKLRRPFLCKLDPNRVCKSPYVRFEAYPAFVDLAAAAFCSFTKEDLFFEFSSLSAAIENLSPTQKGFLQLLCAFQQPEFDALRDVISNMYNADAMQQHVPSVKASANAVEGASDSNDEVRTAVEEDESETETALGHEDDDENKTALEDEEELNTAVDNEEFETKTAIEDDSDEVQTALEDEDEVKTAIGHDEDELNTAVDDNEFETKTAIENDDDETHTALEDDEVKTAIGKDEDPIHSSSQFDVIDGILVNNDVLSLLPGGTLPSGDMFDTKSLVSNDSDFDVILADAVEEPQAVFTTKDYGVKGLTIKRFDNDCVCCEIGDQFVTFDADMAEIGSSQCRDKLPLDIQKLASDVCIMYSVTNGTIPKKNLLVAFSEDTD